MYPRKVQGGPSVRVFDIARKTTPNSSTLAERGKVAVVTMWIVDSFDLLVSSLIGIYSVILTMLNQRQARIHARFPCHSTRIRLVRPDGKRHHIFLPCHFRA